MYTSRSYPACGTHGVTCKQCIECQDLGSETQAAPLTYITLALYRVTTKWETHRQLANRSTKRGSDKKWLKQSRTATGRESILCNGCVSRVECENEWTQKKNLKNKQTQEPAQGVFFRRFLQVTIVELILRKTHDPDKPWNIWEFRSELQIPSSFAFTWAACREKWYQCVPHSFSMSSSGHSLMKTLRTGCLIFQPHVVKFRSTHYAQDLDGRAFLTRCPTREGGRKHAERLAHMSITVCLSNGTVCSWGRLPADWWEFMKKKRRRRRRRCQLSNIQCVPILWQTETDPNMGLNLKWHTALMSAGYKGEPSRLCML